MSRQNPIVDFTSKATPPPDGENEVQVHRGDGVDPNLVVFGTKTQTEPIITPMKIPDHLDPQAAQGQGDCTVCGGKGHKDLDPNNPFRPPIVCPHCNGTGMEPKS